MRYNKVIAKIHGEDRLFIFSMSTIARFCEVRGVNPTEISKEFTGVNKLVAERDMMFSAYCLGYEYEDKKCPKNVLQFEEAVQTEMEQEEYNKVVLCFVNSMTVPKSEASEKKKKP